MTDPLVTDAIAVNLATVDAHIRDEARDPASVMALYTDDIVLEMPTRSLRFTGKAAIQANYERMFGSMADVVVFPGERFATADRVVDDCVVHFRLTGDGLVNAPMPVGSRVILRLLHVFEMRDGRIAQETVFEGWQDAATP
jgi:ketosteroid isomerase-like protein